VAVFGAPLASDFCKHFGLRAFFVDVAGLVAVITANFDRAFLGLVGAHADVARRALVVVIDLWAESL
jgi:hypothetical protein